MLLLFLFAQFVQRQLVQINSVQVPGQYLRQDIQTGFEYMYKEL